MRPSSCFVFVSAVLLGFTTALDRDQRQSFLRRPNIDSNENDHHGIETREIEKGLYSISVTRPTYDKNNESRILRPSRPEYRSCILYMEDLYRVSKDGKDHVTKWVCRIHNYVSRDGNIVAPRAFYVSGGGKKFKKFLNSKAVSGYHVLEWKGPEMVTFDDVDENVNKIKFNSDLTEVGESLWIRTRNKSELDLFEEPGNSEETSGRSLQSQMNTKGTKKTLVIRVVGDGIGPSPSLAEIRDEVFRGENSLKSQIESCSHGQLVIEPFSGETRGRFKHEIIGGVVEIGIQTNPYGKNDKRMENDAIYAATYVFGSLEAQFDLMLFVMPPGIFPDFAAYAYVRTPFSFYMNDSVESTMVLMHEIGHNLGLEHSGQGEEQYGDSSGYMGYSEVGDPRMCFNAVNNYQLDWYNKLSIKPTDIDFFGGTFHISGVDGYNPSDATTYVTLRLEQESISSDYYVGYNRAEGINSGTQEDGNKVIVFTKDGDVDESVNSWKKAALEVGESYVIFDFDNSRRSVTIEFTGIQSNNAVVQITPEISESPTISPVPSDSPSASPSSAPSTNPSSVPSASPSSAPSASPSSAPSASPSFSPSYSPSFIPTLVSSDAPTTQTTETSTFFTTTATTTTTTFPLTTTNETTANMTITATLPPSVVNATTALLATNETANATICDDELFLNIDIRTDLFPEETSWTLKMIRGAEIDRIDPATYQTPFSNHTYSYCLDYDACYLFKIFDTSEDGMGFVGETTESPGYYEAYLGPEQQFRKVGSWGRKKVHKFCTLPPPLDLGNETDFDFEEDLLYDNETDTDFLL